MRFEKVTSDITVVGGGLAGVCAAIAAARLGKQVSLIQNRPVLGGNSSSEVRVWVVGATAHGTQRYARETGIMGELFVENQYRNPEGNPYYWDLVVLEKVKAEPNIQLFLNTDVHEVEADGLEDNRQIHSVTGWMMGSERRIRFESPIFLDCSGDGLIGFLAGAKYRIGREARHEYHEEWAPDVADDVTLGSTILFYTKDVGSPVKYIPPSFAIDVTKTTIPERRIIRSGDSGCHYWWIEWGGEVDIVHDNERIRDELQGVIYGIWDYIKNSGKFDADNLTLEWIGSVPGKREYRRFVGDYVLTQNDVLEQVPFEDTVAFGGWSIDLHPARGMYAVESGSKHWFSDGIYHIPFRSLYSKNVSNLLFAGRNISASHVAFGTTRVMATCAVVGEAAGTGAALCVERGVTPRQLTENHLMELKQTLLRQDAALIGIVNDDPLDLARTATLTASSTLDGIEIDNASDSLVLAEDIAFIIPAIPELRNLQILLDAVAPTDLTVEVWDTGLGQNYVPNEQQTKVTLHLEGGDHQWIDSGLRWTPSSPTARNAFVIVRANPQVRLYVSNQGHTGVLSFTHENVTGVGQAVREWTMRKLVRRPFCIRVHGLSAFEVGNLIDGYRRPFGGPHLWSSRPMRAGQEEYVELKWEKPVQLRIVDLVFNDDVNEDLVNLHHHRTPFDVIPELVKDYRIEAMVGNDWVLLEDVKDNRQRHRVHEHVMAIETSHLRVVIERTNGCNRAELIEVRVYA